MTSKVSIEELEHFFAANFEGRTDAIPTITHLEAGRAVMEHTPTEEDMRPGDYVSGPTQMRLADHAAYVAIFTHTGIVPMAVTSNLSMDFLRGCQGDTIVVDARVVKLGRKLVIINVTITPKGSDKLSSQAVVTYSLPSEF
ncbi:MAG: PaaI family thioesterase [Maricaulaceae bacterium]